jgi:hypothetical protein
MTHKKQQCGVTSSIRRCSLAATIALKVRIVPFTVTELGITFNPVPPSTAVTLITYYHKVKNISRSCNHSSYHKPDMTKYVSYGEK